ncbi:unnamed protein product [Phytophthora lilii]|uniref:Unnamed protein product n=1 Tax=Phytophthora lilii TaxID=2077276 RepID=A0A9W6WYT9_9STRA|nr:unnamed protein product [Phytophthora lilii]
MITRSNATATSSSSRLKILDFNTTTRISISSAHLSSEAGPMPTIFFPVINNVSPCLPGDNDCVLNQHRRKANFLKVESAYFFISPEDGTVTPWQTSHFGRYSEVHSVNEIESKL